jgi:hypothetical protein
MPLPHTGQFSDSTAEQAVPPHSLFFIIPSGHLLLMQTAQPRWDANPSSSVFGKKIETHLEKHARFGL